MFVIKLVGLVGVVEVLKSCLSVVLLLVALFP